MSINDRKTRSVFIRLLIGLRMLAVPCLQALTVLMLWDLSLREGFVLRDGNLTDVLTRLDAEMYEFRKGVNETLSRDKTTGPE